MTVITTQLLDSTGSPANGEIYVRLTSSIPVAPGVALPLQSRGVITNGQINDLKGALLDFPPTPGGVAAELHLEFNEPRPGGAGAFRPKYVINRTVAVPDVSSVEWDDLLDVVPIEVGTDYAAPAWVTTLLVQAVAAGDLATTARDAAVLARDAAQAAAGSVPSEAELSATIAAEVDAAQAVEIYSTAAMSKWGTALGKARRGEGFAKLLCVGDSTTAGFGTTQAKSWPWLLMQRLNRTVSAVPGLALPQKLDTDSVRWSLGGWESVFGPASGALYSNPNAGADAVFTPGINVDTFDIYYYQGSGKGTFVVKIDGVAQTPIDTDGPAGAWIKATYAVAPGTAHTIAFVKPTVNPVSVLGVDAYLSTTKGVRVSNWGVSGSTTDQWVNQPYSLRSISDYAPDLTIIMLGINDAGAANNVPVATWSTRIVSLITEAKKTGDVMIMSVVPTAGSLVSQLALEQAYRVEGRAIAAAQDVPFVDIFGKVGAYSEAKYADDLHPNARGYADIARYVYDALQAF